MAIVGAGALGTLFGYHLAATSEVTMLDVQESVVAEVAARGLTVEREPARAVKASTRPEDVFDCGALFLFVKPTDTLRALRPFAGKLNPATPIVSLQNGLGNEEAIKTALGGSIALVMGATTEASLFLEAGKVRRIGAGTTVVGSRGATQETAKRIASLLEGAGLRASTVYDIRPHLWGKLLVNAAINPLGALLDVENGAIVRDPNAAELARAIVAETAAVAAALRVQLPFRDAWRYVCDVIAASAEIRSSMALDLAAGRRTEIDAINGAVVAAGRRVAVPTPYNEGMMRLIKARENFNAAAT